MIYRKLIEYASGGVYPMHMPGHKRNVGLLPHGLPYGIDITEIHGFDDLHNPSGLLADTAGFAAGLYGSDKAFLLINGSTSGILAAIGAHAKRGDKILFAKSCHRSVHNAVSLFGLIPLYIDTKTDETTGLEHSIEPSAVEAAFEHNPDIRLTVITSPSYEGIISDIKSISDIVHARGSILLVDSAHGAHLGFSGAFPDSAVRCGADVVVMSLHKTLPALTQCSLLHICSKLANTEETGCLLSVLQTSSPSYVLMASIDCCLRLLDSDGDSLFADYERRLSLFYSRVKIVRNLCVFGTQEPYPHSIFARDPGKIVIITKNSALTGTRLAHILRSEHDIELEAAHPGYAIAMTSVCDIDLGFEKLALALTDIDNQSTP